MIRPNISIVSSRVPLSPSIEPYHPFWCHDNPTIPTTTRLTPLPWQAPVIARMIESRNLSPCARPVCVDGQIHYASVLGNCSIFSFGDTMGDHSASTNITFTVAEGLFTVQLVGSELYFARPAMFYNFLQVKLGWLEGKMGWRLSTW
jgi:hypothetical protein